MSAELQIEDTEFWVKHMRVGLFEEAWKFSDAVLKSRAGKPCWHWPRHYQYIWDGTPINNKRVLIRCYHGLGDTIQFIRYAPQVKSIAKKVIVWAQSSLIPLLETAEGIDQLLTLHDGTPEVEYDIDVESMELPHIFRTTLESIPCSIPYLHASPVPLPAGNSLRASIGLVWKSGDWNASRSIPFSLLKSLGDLKNVQFYIIQAEPIKAGWDGKMGIYLGGTSLMEDAQFIRSLDLLITVDTMTAHLAGALGIPVWNLLNTEADWRWMEGRSDSPWYPTMRLFRQEKPGDWESVIREVVSCLKKQFNIINI